MKLKDFFSFRQNRYFWTNLIAMVAVTGALIFLIQQGLGIYTRHGKAVTVPDVKGMSVTDAGRIFRNHNLRMEISDSTYVKNRPAGCVLEQHPGSGQPVKEGRIIYLTVNTLSVPKKPLPDVADNSSMRQAKSLLENMGFKIISIEAVEGERDWVYGVKWKGHEVPAGYELPVGAQLVLMVGDGGGENPDENDLYEKEGTTSAGNGTEAGGTTQPEIDESWFD